MIMLFILVYKLFTFQFTNYISIKGYGRGWNRGGGYGWGR